MTISLRLSDEDSTLIKKYAELKNMTVSEMIRQTVLERIEDEFDLTAYNNKMKYEVEYTPRAVKELKKLDKYTAALIIGWIEKNLVGCEDPRLHGKGLTANRSGQWRYRVGDYRIIAEIMDEKIIILVLTIRHRRDVYD